MPGAGRRPLSAPGVAQATVSREALQARASCPPSKLTLPPALSGAGHGAAVFSGPVEVVGRGPAHVAAEGHLTALGHSAPGGVHLHHEGRLVGRSCGRQAGHCTEAQRGGGALPSRHQPPSSLSPSHHGQRSPSTTERRFPPIRDDLSAWCGGPVGTSSPPRSPPFLLVHIVEKQRRGSLTPQDWHLGVTRETDGRRLRRVPFKQHLVTHGTCCTWGTCPATVGSSGRRNRADPLPRPAAATHPQAAKGVALWRSHSPRGSHLCPRTPGFPA